MDHEPEVPVEDGRRDFLKKCGSFAVITPPAVTFLLSTSMTSKAIASSGRGNGDGDSSLGFLAAGAGAAGVGAVTLPPDKQVELTQPPAPVAPPAAPVAPPPAPPPPKPPISKAGERG